VRVGSQDSRAWRRRLREAATRLRLLRLYRKLQVRSSLDFVAEVAGAFPSSIRKIQTDHGAEFPFTFVLSLERRGIRRRYIRPRCPEQNGKVERSHCIDHDEFWSREGFESFEAAATALRAWERVYNENRLSMALHGRTPAEKLAVMLKAARTSDAAHDPPTPLKSRL
jgi:transposase InsO family protein